jgi:hypothetical protein
MLVRSDGKVFNPPVVHGSSKKKGKKSKPVTPPRRKVPIPIVQEEVYHEVEKLVKTRKGEFGNEYFVKWTGYPHSENSWIGELPPFFDKKSDFYKKTDFEQDFWDGYKSGEDSEVGLEDSDFEIGIEESDSEVSVSSSDCESDFESDVKIGGVKAGGKRLANATDKEEDAAKKRSKKERLVVQALLALSAVVAAGFGDGDESDIEE